MPAFGKVSEGMKIPDRVGCSERTSTVPCSGPIAWNVRLPSVIGLPLLHHSHMEERLDGLSCDGIRPFEEDVHLVGPERRLDSRLPAAMAHAPLPRRLRPAPWSADWLAALPAIARASRASRIC